MRYFKRPLSERAIYYEDEDGNITIRHVQDVEAIAEWNKAQRNQRSKSFKGNTFHHYGKIPLAIVGNLMQRGIWGDPERMKAWLETDEGKMWKSHPGTF